MVASVERYFLGLSPAGFHRVSYMKWGTGPRAIVCVHGLTRNGRDFDRLAEALAERLDATVFCPSVVGRGNSDRLANLDYYGYAQYLADMTGMLARVDADSVDWVGTSMGGLIGMMLAAQAKTPIRRLVVNDVGPFVPKAALERIRDYIGDDPVFPDLAAVEAYFRETYAVWAPMTDADWSHLALHSAYRRSDGSYALAYDPGIANAFRNAELKDFDLWSTWGQIRCPVLAFRGAISDLLLADTAERMANTGPKARIVEVPGAGHCPSLMDEAHIAMVADFLA